MLRRALERGGVGEDGKAGRTARCIGLGEGGWLEIGANEALRRARLLDFGDQPEPPGADGLFQSLRKTPPGRGGVGGHLHLVQGTRRLGGSYFPALVVDDAGQDIGHGRTIRLGPAGGYCLRAWIGKTSWAATS